MENDVHGEVGSSIGRLAGLHRYCRKVGRTKERNRQIGMLQMCRWGTQSTKDQNIQIHVSSHFFFFKKDGSMATWLSLSTGAIKNSGTFEEHFRDNISR